MATLAAPSLLDPTIHAARWIADYCAREKKGDVLCAGRDDPAWTTMFEELAAVAGDDLAHARDRVQRHAADIGTGFRIIGESEERAWPLSPVPLLIEADEWAGIEAGVAQRAELLETILADLYGDAKLVERGLIPAAMVAGSPFFLRPMAGLVPPGGHHLHFIAIDLGRGPTGEWRVLADHLRAPVGAGYALENRLAISRTLGGLQGRLNVMRHAPFFAAYRDGLAAACRRAEPRIGLLTPGRYNPSYPEQAHLARYLGLLLVEGADLAALEDKLYVRTIGGLKRVDAIWNRLDPRLLDPLAFDLAFQHRCAWPHRRDGGGQCRHLQRAGCRRARIRRLCGVPADACDPADRHGPAPSQYRDLVVRAGQGARACHRGFRQAADRSGLRRPAAGPGGRRAAPRRRDHG